MTPPAPPYRAAAVTIILHVGALVTGYAVLVAVFEFPDILQQPPLYRLLLYLREEPVVRPVFWLLAMTGFTQIALAVLLHRSIRPNGSALPALALAFGILAGAFQAAGFVRWAILTPWLAGQIADPGASAATREAVALLEGAFNRYAGMALGEHLGMIATGLWTGLAGAAMARLGLVDARLGWGGVFVAPLALALALEQMGLSGWLGGIATALALPLWSAWLVLVAVSLLRTDARTGIPPPMTWKTVLLGGALVAALLVPSLL